MPVYSSGSRRPGRPSHAFRLAYFDARPRAGIQAVYDGRCPRDEAAQELVEAAAPSRADIELVTAELGQISQRRSSTACGSIRGSLYSLEWKNIFDSEYLVLHLTHRGALWASGAAQAAQFVRFILRWRGL